MQWKDRLGPGIREAWIKMDDDSGFDSLFLGKICDPVSHAPSLFPAIDTYSCSGYPSQRTLYRIKSRQDGTRPH
jgi:hypothetical protein